MKTHCVYTQQYFPYNEKGLCVKCGGDKESHRVGVKRETCKTCNGKGILLDYDRGSDSYDEESCYNCHGSGVK